MNKNDKINWQTKKLGEVCDFYNGLWKGKKPPYIEVGVIRNTNFAKDGELDGSDIAYLEVEKKQFENRKLTYGDIILEKSGGGPKQPVGRVVIFNKKKGDFSFSNFTSAIRVKKSSELDFNFLHRFLFFSYISGITEKMQSHSTGIRNLDSKLYKNIEIPLPPLPEQHRIVKILDDVFANVAKAKENAEKNTQNAKELFESYLQSVFANPGIDWEEKKLGEAYDVRDGTHDSPKYQKEGYALITSKNLKRDELDYQKIKYISEKDYKKINERSKVHKGDILFAMIGTIGNPVVIKIEPDFAIKNVALFKIPKEQNSYFLKYFLDSKFVIDKMMSEAKGTTQKFVGLGYLRNFKIQLPKLDEQKSIVAKLDALSTETRKLETIYQQKLADLEELKKSVLKRAFNGDL